MASLPKSGTVTYEEWLGMPVVNEGREEVVNGEIRITPPNKSAHVRVVARLVAALQRQLDPAKFEVFSGSFGLVIRKEPLTCREPDVAVFERAGEVEIDGYFHSAPFLRGARRSRSSSAITKASAPGKCGWSAPRPLRSKFSCWRTLA